VEDGLAPLGAPNNRPQIDLALPALLPASTTGVGTTVVTSEASPTTAQGVTTVMFDDKKI